MKVILSTKLIIGEGLFKAQEISEYQAQAWVRENNPRNFCGHETVRILGLEPDRSREQCLGYDQALAINAKKRLEFGHEYSVEEIRKIGVEFTLIERIK